MSYWSNFCFLCYNENKSPNFVCQEIGLSNATSTSWKNGAIPKGEILAKVADYFNISTDFLLGRKEVDGEYIYSSLELSAKELSIIELYRSQTSEIQDIVEKMLMVGIKKDNDNKDNDN